MKKFNHEYVEFGERVGGEQYIYRFPNDYGASVVRNKMSYGRDEGLWELAVLSWNKRDSWSLCYSTEITDDVIGYLTEDDVEVLLNRIGQL